MEDPSPEPKKAKKNYPKEFESFWQVYPRKLEKIAASKSYTRAVAIVMTERRCPDTEAHAILRAKAERYAASMAIKDTSFIKHPTTWLNAGCWDDEDARDVPTRSVSFKDCAEPAHHTLDVYKCPECRDTGWIDVWSIKAMRCALRHVRGEIDIRQDRRELYEDVAKCTCAKGQSRPGGAGALRCPPMVKVRVIGTMDHRCDDLIRWAENYGGITQEDFDAVHRS